jgi:CheY-like chemotaxis protein
MRIGEPLTAIYRKPEPEATMPLTTHPPSSIFEFTRRERKTMRILAVEDEPEYLEMLQEVMKSIGHSITIARNGAEAMDILKQQTIDVIVSDVKMPEMNGIDFHQQVRAIPAYRNTPFVFLTGINDLTEVKAVCKEDCDLLLQKPFPIDRLIRLFSGQTK